MSDFPKTIIVRHKKENLKKCSLRGLEARPDLCFFSYPLKNELPCLDRYVLLTLEAGELLSEQDNGLGLLLLDGTWRYADSMHKAVRSDKAIKRRLPNQFVTAYPRRQEDCKEPQSGLASVEALFIAYWILKRDVRGLLDHYYWKKDFLEKNRESFQLPESLL